DIKAKLQEMKDKKHIPAYIKEYVKPEEAVANYDLALKWITTHGHAFISNGPFYLNKFDPTSNYVELAAFRDKTYPFKSDEFPKKFQSTTIRIDDVELASTINKSAGKDVPVKVQVSLVTLPDNKVKPGDEGSVSLLLITPKEEITIQAKKSQPGLFEAVIPAKVINDLKPGAYTILVNAEIPNAIPASQTMSVTLH
ncbi:MAG: hypothetical protein JW795_10570, partial [Chitinivibrionales bacterium]|nr:hypothetical protein [Chitinivibrionales bacterium]